MLDMSSLASIFKNIIIPKFENKWTLTLTLKKLLKFWERRCGEVYDVFISCPLISPFGFCSVWTLI
jgi:hypothetical protein